MRKLRPVTVEYPANAHSYAEASFSLADHRGHMLNIVVAVSIFFLFID